MRRSVENSRRIRLRSQNQVGQDGTDAVEVTQRGGHGSGVECDEPDLDVLGLHVPTDRLVNVAAQCGSFAEAACHRSFLSGAWVVEHCPLQSVFCHLDITNSVVFRQHYISGGGEDMFLIISDITWQTVHGTDPLPWFRDLTGAHRPQPIPLTPRARIWLTDHHHCPTPDSTNALASALTTLFTCQTGPVFGPACVTAYHPAHGAAD